MLATAPRRCTLISASFSAAIRNRCNRRSSCPRRWWMRWAVSSRGAMRSSKNTAARCVCEMIDLRPSTSSRQPACILGLDFSMFALFAVPSRYAFLSPTPVALIQCKNIPVICLRFCYPLTRVPSGLQHSAQVVQPDSQPLHADARLGHHRFRAPPRARCGRRADFIKGARCRFFH